ncbi:MAG: hypothetical protein U1F43_35890 [Myxococcota bacterium]
MPPQAQTRTASSRATRATSLAALGLAAACGSAGAPSTPAAPPGRAQVTLVRMTCRDSGSPTEIPCPQPVLDTGREASHKLRALLRVRPVDCSAEPGTHILHMMWDADQGAVVSTDFEFSPDGVELPECLRASFVSVVADTLTELWIPHFRPHADLVINWNVEVLVR